MLYRTSLGKHNCLKGSRDLSFMTESSVSLDFRTYIKLRDESYPGISHSLILLFKVRTFSM